MFFTVFALITIASAQVPGLDDIWQMIGGWDGVPQPPVPDIRDRPASTRRMLLTKSSPQMTLCCDLIVQQTIQNCVRTSSRLGGTQYSYEWTCLNSNQERIWNTVESVCFRGGKFGVERPVYNRQPFGKFGMNFCERGSVGVPADALVPECFRSADGRCKSKWQCLLDVERLQFAGTIEIWWGHTAGDAAWACKEWIPRCGNNPRGCLARKEF